MHAIFRYPVKSMLGERLTACAVTERGLEGDRVLAAVDVATGRVVSAKHPRKWGQMLTLRARLAAHDPAVAEIVLPGGRTIRSADPGVHEALSEALGRAVRLVGEAPSSPRIERTDPMLDDLSEESELRLGAPSEGGLAAASPPGTLFDHAPVHLVTTATLDALASRAPSSRFDAARFRPNLVLDLPGVSGFAENAWAGWIVRIGDGLVLRVLLPTPRCVVPTLAQRTLPGDAGVLRAVARHNRIEIAGRPGTAACVGAYAEVVRPGVVRETDDVRLEAGPA